MDHILFYEAYRIIRFSEKRHETVEYKLNTFSFHSLEVFNSYHFDSNFLKKNWTEKKSQIKLIFTDMKKLGSLVDFRLYSKKHSAKILLKFQVCLNADDFMTRFNVLGTEIQEILPRPPNRRVKITQKYDWH